MAHRYNGITVFGVRVGVDKILHFIAGFFIASIAFGLSKQSYQYALAASSVAGGIKEVHDIIRDKRVGFENVLDLIATMLGGIVFCGLIRLLS